MKSLPRLSMNEYDRIGSKILYVKNIFQKILHIYYRRNLKGVFVSITTDRKGLWLVTKVTGKLLVISHELTSLSSSETTLPANR